MITADQFQFKPGDPVQLKADKTMTGTVTNAIAEVWGNCVLETVEVRLFERFGDNVHMMRGISQRTAMGTVRFYTDELEPYVSQKREEEDSE